MKYKVYQAQMSEQQIDDLNAGKIEFGDIPEFNYQFDCGRLSNRDRIIELADDAWRTKLVKHVGNINADRGPESAFMISNFFEDTAENEAKIERFENTPMTSMSVSDIIEDEDGKLFVCAPMGFRRFGD
jgi:hypothetical protein